MRIYSFLLVLISLNTLGQQNLIREQIEKLDKVATQDVPKKAPGIATAIISDGKVVFEKYAGYANLQDSIMINDKSRFNIASNGKQFTALAILILADSKKLSLEDDIRKYFPDLYPNIGDKITISNLLNHTSGIRDFYDLLSLQGITWCAHRTATVERFSPPLLAHAIATQTHATPKLWQESNPTENK